MMKISCNLVFGFDCSLQSQGSQCRELLRRCARYSHTKHAVHPQKIEAYMLFLSFECEYGVALHYKF